MSGQRRSVDGPEKQLRNVRARLAARPIGVTVIAFVAVMMIAGTLALGPRGLFGARSELSPTAVPATATPVLPTAAATPKPTEAAPTTAGVLPTPSPSPSPGVTPSPAPTPTPTPTATGWTHVAWSEGVVPWPNRVSVYRQTVRVLDDITPWGGGYVAGGIDRYMAAWPAFHTSDDGLHWRDAGHAQMPSWALAFDGEPLTSWHPDRVFVRVLGDRLAAFARGDWKGEPVAMGPWLSVDGQTWSLVDDSNLTSLSRGVRVLAAAARPGGFVLIGAEGTSRSVILWSVDGHEWSRTTVPGDPQHVDLFDLVASPDGFLIGGRAVVANTRIPAAWYSPDGSSWTAAEVETPRQLSTMDGDEQGTAMARLVVGADGVLALGLAKDNGTMLAWASSNGRSWRLAEPFEASGRYPVIAADGTDIVMLGSTADLGMEWCSEVAAESPLAGWASTDGVHWRSLTLSGPTEAVRPACQWGVVSSEFPGELFVPLDDRSMWIADDRIIVARRGLGETSLDQMVWIGIVSD